MRLTEKVEGVKLCFLLVTPAHNQVHVGDPYTRAQIIFTVPSLPSDNNRDKQSSRNNEIWLLLLNLNLRNGV